MTESLYHDDAYRREFTATVVQQRQIEDGWEILLDRTCFHPGGGGQPADIGWIAEAPVLGVEKKRDGIWHRLNARVEGQEVTGRVDFARRFDFMQQHSGQHIISASLIRVGPYPTVSVHLGDAYTAVEVNCREMPDSDVQAVGDLVNAAISQNLRIRTFWVDGEEIERYQLRRPPPKQNRIRVVEIDGLDRAACGGVHVSSTGEIGTAACVGMERIRGRVRLHWKIGRRAHRDYAEKSLLIADLSKELTCGMPDILNQVAAQQRTIREQFQRIQDIQRKLIAGEVASMMSGARKTQTCSFATKMYGEEDREWLKELAKEIMAQSGVCALLFNAVGKQAQWIAARSADVELSLIDIVRPMLRALDAKGGGSAEICQGILPDPAVIPTMTELFYGNLCGERM